MSSTAPEFTSLERASARRIIELALEEDAARQDITSSICVREGKRARAVIRTRQAGVLAGLPCVAITLSCLGEDYQLEEVAQDGQSLNAGDLVARVEGPLSLLLSSERTFLNLLCSLSGVATLTRSYVDRAGTHCKILDTRKTWPGLRVLQKYAVRCGGGTNHRMGLADAVMVKDNHRAGGRTLEDVVKQVRAEVPNLPLIVEADDLPAVSEALGLGVDRILLDNFDAVAVREACRLRKESGAKVEFEVSGGVHLDSVAELASAGADMVSVGALTHSAPALDLGLDLE
ncbi:MAG TPA: carboxylating nicotinate-nucleotide diphosphorylase [Candidatus Krumholzibacteria bacterium]|nr:carboxylating nicotinate-nucleotide diphosphorylase [Candidatus Krumholzibacteria bacterium]